MHHKQIQGFLINIKLISQVTCKNKQCKCQSFLIIPFLNSLSEKARVATASSVAVSAGQKAGVHDVNFATLVSFNSALFNNLFADFFADAVGEVIETSSLGGGEQAGEDGEDNKDLGEFHW